MNFREYLQCEFDRRRANNRRYSLRSFARWLATDHSTLSQILRGKRRVGVRSMNDLASRLEIDPVRLARYREEEEEHAVMRAITRRDFQAASRWLASRAGISVDHVNIVLQRLLRKGKLRMSGGSLWQIQ